MHQKGQEDTMENSNSRNMMTRLKTLLWISAIVVSLGGSVITREGLLNSIRLVLMMIVLTFIISFYIQMKEERIIRQSIAVWLVGSAFGVSAALLLFLTDSMFLAAGLTGCVLLSGLIDMNTGLFTMYGLGFIRIICLSGDIKQTGSILLLGTILCIAAAGSKTLHSMIYVMMIAVTMNITLEFILCEFNAKNVFVTKTWIQTACLTGIILVCYLVFALSDRAAKRAQTKEEEVTTPANEFWEELSISSEQLYEEVVSEDAVLIARMKQESDKLYNHSKLIATIAKDAAHAVGANSALACAGGWYHEIGRLKGKDYIACGTELIAEYHLPEPIADIIKQQNFKEELPQTKEAAIVMLTDNIVATFSYLKSNQDVKIAPEKVIENTFSVRLGKGSLDDSGLTIPEFNELKKFYLGILPILSAQG